MKNKTYTLIAYCILACNFINAQVNPACTNIGFEANPTANYTSVVGWSMGMGAYTGTNNGICATYSTNLPATITILNPPLISSVYTVPVSPFTGSQVAFLNLPSTPAGFIRMEQTFSVTSSNSFFQYAYVGSTYTLIHVQCCENPYFSIQLFDCSNNPINTGTVAVFPPLSNTASCPGTNTIGMVAGTSNNLVNPNWVIKNVDLSAYIGTCVKIQVEAGTCASGGHGNYLYFDANCEPGPFLVNGNYNSSGTYYACNSAQAVLSSQVANSYLWNGPGSFTSTNKNISVNTPGIYTLTTNNFGNTLTYTLNLQFGITPSLSTSAAPATVCAGQSATLSATGSSISTYSWSGGGNTSSIVVSPTATTVYSVVANASTCPATSSVNVTVSSCTGLQEKEVLKNRVEVYPNPSKGSFKIKSVSQARVIIVDVTGREIMKILLDENNGFNYEVNNLNNGLYFLNSPGNSQKIVVHN